MLHSIWLNLSKSILNKIHNVLILYKKLTHCPKTVSYLCTYNTRPLDLFHMLCYLIEFSLIQFHILHSYRASVVYKTRNKGLKVRNALNHCISLV